MKHLLDVNALIAAIWTSHPHHPKVSAWLAGKSVLLCPVTELGFLRISTNRKVLAVTMADARSALERFAKDQKAERIPADLEALESHPSKSEEVTDIYLADLAAKHGSKLGTMDGGIIHPAVESI